jgi:hypothetical protein
MLALPLVLVALLGAPPAAVAPRPEAAPRPEVEAFRALAAVSAGEPGIADVQEAAAREAERDGPSIGFPLRSRLSALLPRLTAEYRHDEQSNRVVGLQGSGEVDYVRLTPGNAFVVRATWDLGTLVAARGELAAATAAAERARRRAEAVRRATAAFFDRRKARLALLLEPPQGALARAEAELAVDRLTAELDALTGGLLAARGAR